MTQIDILGTIVPAEYDSELFAEEIGKGIITPSTRVLSAIKAANGEPLKVHVNSYGGSVDAGNEILQAIQSYEGDVEVEIGAVAMSMAANLALCCNRKVTAYESSRILFHSAWTQCEGGANAMRDCAKEIEVINAPIRERLAKLGYTDKVIGDSFAEGRQLVISGKEALECGLVSELKGLCDDRIPARLGADVEKLAAFATPEDVEKIFAEGSAKQEEVKAEEVGTAEAAEKPVEAKAEAGESVPEETPAVEEPAIDVNALVDKRCADIQSKAAKHCNEIAAECERKLAEMKAKCDADIEAAKAECDKRVEELKADAAEKARLLAEAEKQICVMSADIASANARADAVVGSALTSDNPMVADEPTMSRCDARRVLAALPPKDRMAFYKAHQGLLSN